MSAQLNLDRVSVVPCPSADPAICVICGYPGGDPNRSYVDVGLNIEFYGAVYFCLECWNHVASKLGYVGHEQKDQMERTITRLHKQLRKAEEEKDAANRALDAVLNVRPNLASRGDSPTFEEFEIEGPTFR